MTGPIPHMSANPTLQDYRDAFADNPSTINWGPDTVLADLDDWIAEHPVEPSTQFHTAVNVLHFAEGAIQAAQGVPGVDRQTAADLAKAHSDLVALRQSDWFITIDERTRAHASEVQRKDDVLREMRRQLEAAHRRAERLATEAARLKDVHVRASTTPSAE